MLNTNELKNRGLRYLRSLQVVFRMAAMFNVDHMSAAGPLQQSFDSLNALIKETLHLTVGFVDNRVMINNLLTVDRGLAQLENEFLKRGIGGLSFEPGITAARYKKVIAIIATHPKAILEMGGVNVLIAANPIEGVKIFPAGKNQTRTDTGDTIIDSDADSYLRAKQFDDQSNLQIPTAGLELIFSSAGLEKPDDMSGSGPAEIIRLVQPTVEAALVMESGDPQKSYLGLARMLQEIHPGFVMNFFTPEQQKGLEGKGPREIAGQFMEHTAMRWAARRLANAPEGDSALVVEDDVVRVLLRTLQATQMAEKLAERLAHYVKEYTLPKSIYDRIQEELRWTGTPLQEKVAKMLRLERFGPTEFRRLVELLKDLLGQQKTEQATAVAKHYFNFLDADPASAEPEPFSRATELVRTMAGVRTDFAPSITDRMAKALMEERYRPFVHYQIANCLGTVSKAVATFEEFELVQQIGSALERSAARDRGAHAECCATAMKNLLAPTSIERVVELLVMNRDDAAWCRMATSLLRWSGKPGIEKAYQRLEEEKMAGARLALLRFLGQMGESGVEVACARLSDERWYVVRNTSQVLGELKDPKLLEHVGPLLRHQDHRVQQSALNVILKSRANGRAKVLAEALNFLRAHILDQTLEELAFLKDEETVEGLASFLFGEHHPKKPLDKAVAAAAAISGAKGNDLLLRVMEDSSLPQHVRRSALQALVRRCAESGVQDRIEKFAQEHAGDALAQEARSGVARGASKSA